MKVRYETDKGVIEVEVDEVTCAALEEIESKTKNSNRRETRRHNSYEDMHERYGYEAIDTNANIEQEYIQKESFAELLKYITSELTPEQQSLIQALWDGQTVTEIAQKEGVSKQAISDRRKRIKENIKKFLSDP